MRALRRGRRGRRPAGPGWRAIVGLAGTACLFASGAVPPAAAQEAPPRPDSSFLSPPVDAPPVSPGGAFLRSLLVPGWGHAAVGAHSRGAFYFSAAVGSGYMLFKTTSNRAAASRVLDARVRTVEAELRLAGTPEDSIAIRVEEDERVQEAQALVDTRSQQVQDWAALGIFIVLLSGADAFVSAHLMDFPEPLTLETVPGRPGRIEVGARFPWAGPGR